MPTRHPPVPPKGMGVWHIPKSTVDAMLEAAGLKPEWVMSMSLYGGQGTIKLSVPVADLATPLVDAAGLDPDSFTTSSTTLDEFFGPHGWSRSSDHPDYQGEGMVYVVPDRKEAPRAKRAR